MVYLSSGIARSTNTSNDHYDVLSFILIYTIYIYYYKYKLLLTFANALLGYNYRLIRLTRQSDLLNLYSQLRCPHANICGV